MQINHFDGVQTDKNIKYNNINTNKYLVRIYVKMFSIDSHAILFLVKIRYIK